MFIGNYSGSIFPLFSRDVVTTDGRERRGQGCPFPKKQRENKLPVKVVSRWREIQFFVIANRSVSVGEAIQKLINLIY
jgi:hypothetical protein